MDFSKILNAHGITAYIVNGHANKRYLTNFSGTNCEVIIKGNQIYFITDGRYKTQVEYELYPGIKTFITRQGQGYFDIIGQIIGPDDIVGIDESIQVFDYERLKFVLAQNELKLLSDIIAPLRMIKTEEEIEKIREAINISQQAFLKTLPLIKPGITEREIKAHLEANQILLGADDYSFSSIIASGVNSAKPHASFSDKEIEEGDVLTIDFGCFFRGYASDITRTFFVGENTNPVLANMHDLVSKCLELQISKLKPGITCREIDQIGREFFKEHNMEEFFMHSTGHGIGLDIHEQPYLNYKSEQNLEAGMVITIEPGLYIPKLGGVRIEQDVLITPSGCEVLTSLPTSYNILNERD